MNRRIGLSGIAVRRECHRWRRLWGPPLRAAAQAAVTHRDSLRLTLSPHLDSGSTPMINGKTVIVVLPAYNAAKTLERTIADVPPGIVNEFLLVNDASATIRSSRRAGSASPASSTRKNQGYGGNQKTCYTEALRRGADIVVMLHPDYQYSPKLIGSMAWHGRLERVSTSCWARGSWRRGARGRDAALQVRGQPVPDRVENILLGIKLSEYHTGYRAFSRRVLETLPLDENSDDFVFDNQMLAQAVAFGFGIGEISCPTQIFPRGLIDQLPPLRALWFRCARDGVPVPAPSLGAPPVCAI